jgi:methanogenic corrinoid protein MtbC1
MAKDVLERLVSSVLALEMEATLENVQTILGGDGTITAQEAVDALSGALEIIGRRFQDGDWFLGELVYAGEICKTAFDLLSPRMRAATSSQFGTVVVGTVAGDLHDLGKNIFTSYAQGTGFEVVDLGVDVRRERFLDVVKEKDPVALGLSCLLTITAGEVGKVIEALKSQGLRDKVKVIVGGAALTERFAREVGADAFAPDVVTGTEIIKTWSVS